MDAMLMDNKFLFLQNPFKYPRPMQGLQAPLSSLPTVGVYVVGAALIAVLGGVGSTGVAAVAPGKIEIHHMH